MAIYRGIGGAGENNQDATITAVTEQAVAAAASATAASTSAGAASSSATAAATSASNAATSETNAAASETAAAASETAAAASESAAASSASNAAASETAAASSASAAATSATASAASAASITGAEDASAASAAAALASETAAGISETNAASSAAAASTSATNASNSETAAAGSASSASSSASAAASSASSASSSASAASTSATAAAASATAAGDSETAAAASETAAGISEVNAATSETNAASSASAASASQSAAATSATNASNSASAASTSETNAAASASAASASEAAAAASFDAFDDRYLGAKASDPSVDNDGNALLTGALYFDTSGNIMKVYSGSSWVAAYATLSGALFGSNNLSDVASVSSSRSNLGLGTGDNVVFNQVETTNGLIVGGDLTVNGTLSTINTENLAVSDNMIYLNDGSTVTNPDLGWAGNYNDGTYAHAGVFRDATDGQFKFYDGYTPEPGTEINTGHASFSLADVAAGTFYGALSGNASTATALQTARTIGLSGDVTGSTSFDGTGNATITATVVDDSHSHSTSTITGLDSALASYAPLASPALTGTPTVPTAAVDTNTTQAASTAFVVAQIADDAPTKTGTGASGTWGINITGNAATSSSTTGNAATATAPASGGSFITSSNIGSQSVNYAGTAGNAYTTGGYSVSTTADAASTIPVRDVNGYLNLGWINTTSGDAGTNTLDRVYAGGSDGYIRYYTAANFRTVLDVPTKGGSGASGTWGISITGNAATATTATTATSATNATNASYATTAGNGGVTSVNGQTGAVTVAGLPAGAIASFAMSSAPSGWLKANGAAVSRSTYSDLFAAIGTTYGSGDGSSTFNLPDLRGEFLRGWDDGRGVDSGRGFGSFQSHAYGSHNHNFRVYDYGGGGYQNVFGYPQAITNGGDRAARGSYNAEKDHLVQYSGGSETRPRNVALLVCIKT